jgi:hypothetical protein
MKCHVVTCTFLFIIIVLPVLAVELQPYGYRSKNLDGYRRAVVPPIHKT